MHSPSTATPGAAETIIAAARRLLTQRKSPLLIALDGAYSTRPELVDLIDLTVLVDAPLQFRHARLAAREAACFLEAWHRRWDDAEAHYFTHVRPPSSFDLVVSTA